MASYEYVVEAKGPFDRSGTIHAHVVRSRRQSRVQRDLSNLPETFLADSPVRGGYHPNGLSSHPTNHGLSGFAKSESDLLSRVGNESAIKSKKSHGDLPDAYRRPPPYSSEEEFPDFPFAPHPVVQRTKQSAYGVVRPSMEPREEGLPKHFVKSRTNVHQLGNYHAVPALPQSHMQQAVAHRGGQRGQYAHVPFSKTAPLHQGKHYVVLKDDVEKEDELAPIDVQQKVSGMLAASRALKGPQIPAAQTQTLRQSKMARITQKLSNKLTKAWGKIQRKPAARQSSDIKLKISGPLELISSTRMLVSPKSPRVIRRSFSLPSARAVAVAKANDIPKNMSSRRLASPIATPTPVIFATRASLDESDIFVRGSALGPNPFLDNAFDDDLDAFLPQKPIAASTPRPRRQRASSLDESPTLRRGKLIVPRSESVSTMEADESPFVGKAVALSQLKLTPSVCFYSAPHGPTSKKKHPAPPREDLRDYASKLTALGVHLWVTPLENPLVPAPSASPDTPGTPLAPKDKNAPVKRDTGKLREENDYLAGSGFRKTRIPCPTGSTRISHYGLVKHPDDPEAFEPDELA